MAQNVVPGTGRGVSPTPVIREALGSSKKEAGHSLRRDLWSSLPTGLLQDP